VLACFVESFSSSSVILNKKRPSLKRRHQEALFLEPLSRAVSSLSKKPSLSSSVIPNKKPSPSSLIKKLLGP
jgi:hypothetical protein